MSEKYAPPQEGEVHQKEEKIMASAADKVVAVLKSNSQLRSQLNTALDNIFVAANLGQLTLAEKESIMDAIKKLLVVDKKYTNIHVHWT